MICQSCLYRLRVSRISGSRFAFTTANIAKTSTFSAPRGPLRGSHEGAPAATSTSAAQPFSTPLSSSTPPLSSTASSEFETVISSVPAGTPLKGLGYLKGKDPPLAKEVHEYPSWLWGLLDEGKEGKNEDGDDLGDTYCKSLPRPGHLMPFKKKAGREIPSFRKAWFSARIFMTKSKKERRKAARAALKAARANPESLVPKVPIEHQSIDLPAGDGTIAGALAAVQAREEIRGALRIGRRKKIKEGNFLKAMR
ncbi:hypothetical protein MMC18_003927 [Xylographa bjoerkii]|nr:hypothetical protein [Xylographa bjoerkii]